MRLIENLKEKYNMHKVLSEEVDMLSVMSSNSIKANKTIFIVALVSLITDILTIIYGVLDNEIMAYLVILAIATFNCIIVILVSLISKFEGKHTKVILVFCTILNAFLLSTYIGYVGCCMFVLCIILTIQYFDVKLTIFTAIFSEILYALSIVVYSMISFKSGILFVRLTYLPMDSIARNGENTVLTLTDTDLTSFSEYLSSQFSFYFIMFSLIILFTAIIAIRSAVLGGQMVLEEAETMAAKAKVELENNETKTKIMISQIQPHFIYNTLNTIYYLCEKEPLVAQQAIGEFADYLRENLNLNSSKEVVPFSQEFGHIQKYLSLEKMRFEDELNIEYDIQCTCFKVPSLSLQPLVENAVKHGLGKKTNGGTLKITTLETYECYEVRIQDDGVGFDKNKPFLNDRVHIGIENTKERLEKMIGATLMIESQVGVGTLITIKIPKENYYEDISR